jgi:hypothetical protein
MPRFICEYGPTDKVVYLLEVEAADQDAAEALFTERLPGENLISCSLKSTTAQPLDLDDVVIEEREDA